MAGALSAALIPVFSGYRARDQESEAWQLASSVINLVVIALAALSLLMAIFAPIVVPIVAPGFVGHGQDVPWRVDRRSAIARRSPVAGPGDVVVIAGKGTSRVRSSTAVARSRSTT